MKFRYTIGLVGNDSFDGNKQRFLYMSDPYVVNNSSLINRDGHGFLFGINNSTVSPAAYENGKNGMHKNTSGMFYYILIEKRKKYADKAWFILLTQRGERCY